MITTFTEFEMLFFQLNKHSQLLLLINLQYLKAHLKDQAQKWVNSPVDSKGFFWQKNPFETAKQLKTNTNIYFTRSDKGAGVVILNRSDYIDQMYVILDDVKFHKLGYLSCDDTLKMQVKIQKQFLQSYNKNFFLKKVVKEFVLLVHKDQG